MISIDIQVNHEGGHIKIEYGEKLNWYRDDGNPTLDAQVEAIQKECQRSVKILRGSE